MTLDVTPLQMQLHTTVLRVENLQRTREFFETKLDMRVVYEDPHYKLVHMVKGPDTRVTFWEARESERRTCTGQECAYMVFITQNARADHAELRRRGVDVSPIEEHASGLRLFWLSDPDTNQFCIIQFLPE